MAAMALVFAGCVSSQYPDIDEPMPPGWFRAQSAPPTTTGIMTAASVAQEGTLRRADVERVVDAGLGRFLSLLAIEASLSGGRFTGWSIVELRPVEAWRGIDLRPGDVVTRINGMAIEREMEAYEAFQAVRQAPSLEVSYLRQGQRRTLRYTIIGAPSLPPSAPRSPVPG
jgi:S1-C subfamily serine protease